MSVINLRLKAAIIRRFGSAEEFAHHVGYHSSEISRVVRGHRQLSIEEIENWARILEVEPEQIGFCCD